MAINWGKQWRQWHLWLSSVGAVITLFFAVTGFILNQGWAEKDKTQQTVIEDITVPTEVLSGDRLTIVEHLRNKAGAFGQMRTYEAEEDFLFIEFMSPRGSSTYEIDTSTGVGERATSLNSSWRVLGLLHMGKDTSIVWRRIIDVGALLMAVSAASGLLLLWNLPKRRAVGFVLVGVGGVAPAVVALLSL